MVKTSVGQLLPFMKNLWFQFHTKMEPQVPVLVWVVEKKFRFPFWFWNLDSVLVQVSINLV
jgi:hypothetical protein